MFSLLISLTVILNCCLYDTSVLCFSASSIHLRAADSVPQQSVESDSVGASFPSTASTPELHAVDASDAVKVRNLYEHLFQILFLICDNSVSKCAFYPLLGFWSVFTATSFVSC